MNSSLPAGWRWCLPAELAAPERHALGIGPFGSDLKVSDYAPSGVPLVFVRNIRAEHFKFDDQPHISDSKAAALSAHRVVGGDVLITKMGEPPGDATIYPPAMPEARMTADCIRLRVNESLVSPKFVVFATRSSLVSGQIAQATKGVAQKKISLERFKAVQYPIAPFNEQRRIVDALETHFSRLDAAEASLRRAKANVKRARASVLQAAVEGRLVPTEAELARAEGREYEPASVLLERILNLRRAAWERGASRGKYKQPAPAQAPDGEATPDGWVWVSVDALATKVVDGVHKKPTYQESGVPFITVRNLTAGS